jgi:chromosomal replication initiator protein
MDLTPKDAWTRLLAEARREFPDATVRTWLEPVRAMSLGDGRLVVAAPDQFAVEWNASKHAAPLSRLASTMFGQPLEIVFQVQEERAARPQMDFFVPAAGAEPQEAISPSATPLNERYLFETFVIGKSNELAAAAAHAVAEAPGKTYNPLFIYGATGLGKTHLMQAIAHAVLKRDSRTRVAYMGAEQFINEVIEGIHGRNMPEFRKHYRSEVDMFLVDDVHFLEGKEMTQEEFFHTFNALHEAGKQIVLTSDRPPKEIPGLESRLVSRFEWGMVADIGQPDLEHRIAILRKKAEQDHLELTIPDDVLRFIAEHVRSSVRELSSIGRSPSSWRGRRCRTRSSSPTEASRLPAPCRASLAFRRSSPAAGGLHPRDSARKHAPSHSPYRGRWPCSSRVTCWACNWSRSGRPSEAAIIQLSSTASAR